MDSQLLSSTRGSANTIDQDEDLAVLERSVYTQLLSEMAAMRTGLLQLQGFLQQEPAVAGDEDRGDKEVEGDMGDSTYMGELPSLRLCEFVFATVLK